VPLACCLISLVISEAYRYGLAVIFWPKHGRSVQKRSMPPSVGQISPHGVKCAGQANFSVAQSGLGMEFSQPWHWLRWSSPPPKKPKERCSGVYHTTPPCETHVYTYVAYVTWRHSRDLDAGPPLAPVALIYVLRGLHRSL
jgi:hypothetical protein